MTAKLWPLNQFLEWLDKCDSKYVNLNASEYLVLIAILKFADEKWQAHPSIKRICNLILKDKKHVEDVINRLIEKKILRKKIRYTKDGDRDNNQYTISVDNIWKVGANSPLPWGQIYPYGRGKSTPLTIYTTNHTTKKKGASRGLRPNKDQKPQEVKQLAKFWEPGNPDYDRTH